MDKKKKFLDAHETDGVVVSCIDFRFRPKTANLLKKTFKLDHFDAISLAGGAACFSLPSCSERSRVVCDDVGLAVKAHHVHTIILLSHQNCGKIASLGFIFKNRKEEKAFHVHALKKAAECIFEEISHGHKVKMYLGYVAINPRTDKPKIEKVLFRK